MRRFALRPATADDIPSIARVVNAGSLDVLGTARALVDPSGDLRLARSVRTTAEKTVAVDNAGQVVGFLYLMAAAPYVVIEIEGAVHPECRGYGIGTMLMDWAETRAAQLVPGAPPN